MRKLAFSLIALLFGISMITNAQVTFIANGQAIMSNNSWDIRLVDLNADSIPDAVFESKVWLNDGNGNFTKSGLYIGSGLYPGFADLNSDGFVDVLNQDSIFLNDGSFNFSYSKKLVSDISMYSSVLADIDKDDDIDIISCSDLTDRILLNDGAGNFTNTNKSLGGWGQANYAVGDINGDGFTDIYVSIPHIPPMGGHTPNLIWQGDGAGNFAQKTHDIAGAESRAAILADFDGDDDLDLYDSDATSWGRIFINDGEGNFTNSGQKLGSHTGAAKSADFNVDGKLDLFICQGDGNGVAGNGAPGTVWLGDGKGFFTDSKVRLQIGNTNSMAVDAGDVNNDGKIDAVVANVKLDAQNGYIPISCPVEIWINKTFICDYFGQTPPGNTAIKFAPGIISLPNRLEFKIAYSPDGNECYFTVYDINDNTYKIYCTKRVNNLWTEQIVAPFSVDQNVELSSLSADGNRLYFDKDGDIWMVERTTSDWGEPQRLLSPINSSSLDGAYTETSDSVAYINSCREGSFVGTLQGNWDIWCIHHMADQSIQAENLGAVINSSIWQVTPYIAPDGSYLIYTQSNSNYMYLYISFNKGNGEWTVPMDMNSSGAEINVLQQNSPSISPDGKYLFFNRHDNPTSGFISDIYWVSTSIIDTLRTMAFTSSVENPEANNLISVFPNPAKNKITINISDNMKHGCYYQITNINGKVETRGALQSETIDISGLAKGLYLLSLHSNEGIMNKKIVVE